MMHQITWRRFASAVLCVTIVWCAVVLIFDFPDYILPSPWQVVGLLLRKWEIFLAATCWTALEALLGFTLGCIAALLLGGLAAVSTFLRNILEPVIVLSQTFPIQAIAPLLVIWFGFGILPKVIVAGLICFFPLAIATIRGLTAVDKSIIAVTETLGATVGQTFTKVRLPSALLEIVSALKVAATLSVIGAVIGEFVSPQRGLGYLILSGQAHLQTDTIFAALLMLGVIGLSFYLVAASVEHALLRNRRIYKEGNRAKI